MARRNNKKMADLSEAQSFTQLVIDELKRYEKTNEQKSAMENCIKQLPAMKTLPMIRRRHLTMLNSFISGKYSSDMLIFYFKREKHELSHKIRNFK